MYSDVLAGTFPAPSNAAEERHETLNCVPGEYTADIKGAGRLAPIQWTRTAPRSSAHRVLLFNGARCRRLAKLCTVCIASESRITCNIE